MRRLFALGVAALASLAGTASAGRADIVIQVPFVTVRVGRPAVVVTVGRGCAPPIVITAPVRAVAPAPPGGPISSVPIAPPADPVPPVQPAPTTTPVSVPAPAPVAVRALTLGEFVAAFRPCPGTHEAYLVHPVTGAPVKVCFTLPPGSPRKVRVHRRDLEFVYGHRQDVEIRFLRDGRVQVRN